MIIKKKEVLFWYLLLLPIIDAIFNKFNITVYLYNLGLILLILLSLRMKDIAKVAIIVLCLLFYVAITFSNVYNYALYVSHFLKFLSALLCMYFFSLRNNIERFYHLFQENIKVIKSIVIIIIFLNLIMQFSSSAYLVKWSGRFFMGLYAMPHTFAYAMIIIQVLILAVSISMKNNKFMVFTLYPLYGIFESGVRTALLIEVILIHFIVSYFSSIHTKKKILKIIKYLSLIVMLLLIFILIFGDIIAESSMVSKIMALNSADDISSGRFEFWPKLLDEYKNENLLNQLFGIGDDQVYRINLKNVGLWIWAHSDYIQILIGKGAICLVMYLTVQYSFFKRVYTITTNKFVFLLSLLIFLILAFTNGFYTYSTSLLIPMIAIINIVDITNEKILKKRRG